MRQALYIGQNVRLYGKTALVIEHGGGFCSHMFDDRLLHEAFGWYLFPSVDFVAPDDLKARMAVLEARLEAAWRRLACSTHF